MGWSAVTFNGNQPWKNCNFLTDNCQILTISVPVKSVGYQWEIGFKPLLDNGFANFLQALGS
jgi:hypothetical protein